MKIISLDQHPLLQQWFRLMRKTETLPAHPDQTTLITNLGAWGDELKAMLDKHGLLRKPPALDLTMVKVLKVKYDGGLLILRESEKNCLWDYFLDWGYDGVTLEFTTMPEAQVAALPEFDGF